MFGLLGPNGAGKTSMIRMITGITYPDSGQILFMGQHLVEDHQKLMGYMPEERGLYKKMKVLEQMIYMLQLRGLSYKNAKSESETWLEKLGLEQWKNNKVGDLSKGMQQKIQFIITVAHKPKLLILDEPFSGLDPINSKLIEETIRELQRNGTTIIFSTHRMEQVEYMCDEIALVNNAKILLNDSIKNIKRNYKKNIYILESDDNMDKIEFPDAYKILERNENFIKIHLPEDENIRNLVSRVNDEILISRVELYLPTINEIFIEVVENK